MRLYQKLLENRKKNHELRKKLYDASNGIDPMTEQESELCYNSVITDTLQSFLDIYDPKLFSNQKEFYEGHLKIWDPTKQYPGSFLTYITDEFWGYNYYTMDGDEEDFLDLFNGECDDPYYHYWGNDNVPTTRIGKLTLIVEEESDEHADYSGYVVYGSWDNWQSPELLKKETWHINEKWNEEEEEYIDEKYIVWTITFSDKEIPKKGWHTYKLQKDGVWIEPGEFARKQQNKEGVWNNVIYIHS